jgi:NDP-sugar pyrophosphorylase family protein
MARLAVAILAGGLATRLGALTERKPKSLVEVAGKPFIQWQLELLGAHGIEEVVVCAGHRGEQIEAAIGDGAQFGLRVRYSYDGPERLGTGGALKRALPALGAAFLALYGDSYLECDYAAVERAFLESGKLGLMTVLCNEGRWDTSNVEWRAGRIERYDKQDAKAEMKHIDYGLGGLRAAAFDAFAPGTALDLASVYQALLARGELAGYEVTQRFYEIGSVKGLEETTAYLRSKSG